MTKSSSVFVLNNIFQFTFATRRILCNSCEKIVNGIVGGRNGGGRM